MFIQKGISSLVLYSWHASRDSCLHFTMDFSKSLEKTGSCAHSSSNSIFQMLPLLLQPLSKPLELPTAHHGSDNVDQSILKTLKQEMQKLANEAKVNVALFLLSMQFHNTMASLQCMRDRDYSA